MDSKISFTREPSSYYWIVQQIRNRDKFTKWQSFAARGDNSERVCSAVGRHEARIKVAGERPTYWACNFIQTAEFLKCLQLPWIKQKITRRLAKISRGLEHLRQSIEERGSSWFQERTMLIGKIRLTLVWWNKCDRLEKSSKWCAGLGSTISNAKYSNIFKLPEFLSLKSKVEWLISR